MKPKDSEVIYKITVAQTVPFPSALNWSIEPIGELIRCKDCKFYVPQYDKKGFYCGNCQYMQVAEANGFCHMAERKEE